jgi:predicted HicB family RNase H-like nuclease
MPTSKPRRVGRPALPKGNAKRATVRVRSTPNELRSYEMAAKASKQSLSEWIRGTLNAAVESRG